MPPNSVKNVVQTVPLVKNTLNTVLVVPTPISPCTTVTVWKNVKSLPSKSPTTESRPVNSVTNLAPPVTTKIPVSLATQV